VRLHMCVCACVRVCVCAEKRDRTACACLCEHVRLYACDRAVCEGVSVCKQSSEWRKETAIKHYSLRVHTYVYIYVCVHA
jgi:hypothetical protein